jgi:hypothetical protein
MAMLETTRMIAAAIIVTINIGGNAQSVVNEPERCEQEGAQVLGTTPIRLGPGRPAPVKTKDVQPIYPDIPPNRIGNGNWVGDVLIGTDGKVAKVWTIRKVEFRPPFDEFTDAIVSAVLQWQFQPIIVDSQRTPACLRTTVLVRWP